MKNLCFKSRLVALLIVLFSFVCLNGCAELEARDQAKAGKKALKSCRFADAYEHFDRANDLVSGNEEILLGLGISEILTVVESEEVRAILPLLGITKSLEEACLEALEDDDESEETEEASSVCGNVKFDISHESSDNHIIEISPELTWQALFDAVYTNREKLYSASKHLQRSARKIDGAYSVGDVFGYKEVKLHSADIAGAASIAAGLSFVSGVLYHYSLSFSVKETLDNRDKCIEFSNLMNSYVFRGERSIDVDRALESYELLRSAIGLVVKYGEDLWNEYDAVVDNPDICFNESVLKWENVPYGIYYDLEKVARLELSDGLLDLDELIDPAATLDLVRMLENLPTQKSGEIVTCTDDKIVWTVQELAIQLNQVMLEPVFDESSDGLRLNSTYDYRLNSAWLNWDFAKLIP